MNAPPVLLLTRPRAQSEAFLARCEARLGREIEHVITPVMRIEALGVPRDLSAETLVLTSSNGVRMLGNRLRGRRVATVGEATAELAGRQGADAICLGATAEDLLTRSDELAPPVLVCRGRHARRDLAADLVARGIEARALTIYDQVETPLTLAGQSLLQGNRPILAPLFSPRSAALLSRAAIAAPITCLALSPAVAAAWTGPGAVKTAETPNAEALCDLVTALI
ncbi:MAG: uroporphyrinogen-III synthase [Silicimonas sp.]|nr:uroporphyrinogen-III synthase [Silicimonas sp.]